MNKYIKGGVVINATEKAYNLIYRGQGYVPYDNATKEVSEIETPESEVTEKEIRDVAKMKKDELVELALEKGIEIPDNATKEVLISLITELEEADK